MSEGQPSHGVKCGSPDEPCSCQQAKQDDAKARAIQRIAIFMSDRVDYVLRTGDGVHTTREAIVKLLEEQLSNV